MTLIVIGAFAIGVAIGGYVGLVFGVWIGTEPRA
jgi:hypothetical protein